MQTFSATERPPDEEFTVWAKTEPTRAKRIEGPFQVLTAEGVMSCLDGWLALDASGNPYPIADDIFRATYATYPAALPDYGDQFGLEKL
jgi:hypothetical protein